MYHIYLISFNETNDIYIGKTTYSINSSKFKERLKDIPSINKYVNTKLEGKWTSANIDIIDTVNTDKDIKHLYKLLDKNITDEEIKLLENNKQLYDNIYYKKLQILQHYHIMEYKNNNKYNLINVKIPTEYNYNDYKKIMGY